MARRHALGAAYQFARRREGRGVDLVYYSQVDNPLVEVLEPAFLGHHLLREAEFSAKVVRKSHPTEKVGLVVRQNRKPTVIEYCDLPNELAHAADANGQLKYWPGSIAIHIFSRPFLERITATEQGLPFHLAFKAVPHIDSNGNLVQPTTANAIKFERFIFDALPLARQVAIIETAEEFAPVKNDSGEDSWPRNRVAHSPVGGVARRGPASIQRHPQAPPFPLKSARWSAWTRPTSRVAADVTRARSGRCSPGGPEQQSRNTPGPSGPTASSFSGRVGHGPMDGC